MIASGGPSSPFPPWATTSSPRSVHSGTLSPYDLALVSPDPPGAGGLWAVRHLWCGHHHHPHPHARQQLRHHLQVQQQVTSGHMPVADHYHKHSRNRLWRSRVSTMKRLATSRGGDKATILLNLATSSGMSGVILLSCACFPVSCVCFPVSGVWCLVSGAWCLDHLQVHHAGEVDLSPVDGGSRLVHDNLSVQQVL